MIRSQAVAGIVLSIRIAEPGKPLAFRLRRLRPDRDLPEGVRLPRGRCSGRLGPWRLRLPQPARRSPVPLDFFRGIGGQHWMENADLHNEFEENKKILGFHAWRDKFVT